MPAMLKLGHLVLFGFISIVSIIELAITSAQVKLYNDNGYPDTSIRDRTRLLLVASIWSVAFYLYLTFAFLLASGRVISGVLVHLIGTTIAFLLFIIGSAALQARMTGECGKSGFYRCNVERGVQIVAWIDTVFIFISWVFVVALAFKARGNGGVRRSTLVDA